MGTDPEILTRRSRIYNFCIQKKLIEIPRISLENWEFPRFLA